VISAKIIEEIIGYSSVFFNTRNNSLASKYLPLEYRPDEKDRPASDSNVFADLIK